MINIANTVVSNELSRLNSLRHNRCSVADHDALIAHILANPGGGTIENWKVIDRDYGYQVAITGGRHDKSGLHRFPEDKFNEALTEILRLGGCCGYWQSKETKEWCIDISLYVADKEIALEIGREYDQESVFEWGTYKCVDCITGEYLPDED